MASFSSKKTISSGEVTLNILKYPGYKWRTEDLEGYLDSEQWDEDEQNLQRQEQIREFDTF